MIETYFEGNKRFIEKDFSQNPEHYQKLSTGQSPKALFIGCSDSRVNPERIVDAGMGEIFVHRNIGNIVAENDPNIATVLEYAVDHLGVEDVVIFGHSDCGAMKALEANAHGEYIPVWLDNVQNVKQNVTEPKESPKRLREVEVENIRQQAKNLRSYPLIKKAEDDGKITIYGLYYDLVTGELSKIV